ncbi:MAG: putative membrane protein [Parvicellaceae bacterium]|jgi:uncharacterized membrane protein
MDGNTRTIAILAYCSIIGYGVAWIMHSQNKSVYGAYHLRQGTGVAAASIALPTVVATISEIPLMGITIIPAIALAVIGLTVIGIINASNDKFTELPVVGKLFSKWFSFID